jgi:hypothetical protein
VFCCFQLISVTHVRHRLAAVLAFWASLLVCGVAAAQTGTSALPHDMQHMHMSDEAPMEAARDASGTSWLPDDSPMYALHRTSSAWMLMAHGNGFLQVLHDAGPRGSTAVGSINWIMGMAGRPAAGGRLEFRAMASFEPWTIAGCGYPDLLATGELCRGVAIHDLQHPHDLVMEVAAKYDRAWGAIRWQVYGGPAGEPALGPTAFAHRISATPNPIAPITHHWFDSTHITYGVVTGGVYGGGWKVEGSVFNGREPDENRTNLDFGPLDSWSGRVWLMPSRRWALQVSAGKLKQAEAEPDGARTDVERVTASATYHRTLGPRSIWASTVGWGRNAEPRAGATNAFLSETNVTFSDRDSVFGRFELSEKSGHDLAIPWPGVFTVARIEAGYTRYAFAWRGLRAGIGGAASASVVPDALTPVYGRRVNPGFAAFLTVRPADHSDSM